MIKHHPSATTRRLRLISNLKYCRSCWRYDVHRRCRYPMMIVGALTVLTCGLYWVVGPSQCTCCGKRRWL